MARFLRSLSRRPWRWEETRRKKSLASLAVEGPEAPLLSEPPVAPRVKHHTANIFSTRNRSDFLSYLAALEAEADPDHVNLVVRTYGEEWLQPYRSMLEHERNKGTTSR